MKTLRIAIPIMVVAALAIASVFWLRAGPSDKEQPPKPSIVTIATFSKALGNTPYYVAKHFKWFEEGPEMSGVRITYKEYNDRPAISDGFASGELQVLFSADIPSIICRAQGNDIRAVALSAIVTQNIVVRTELSRHTLEDLKGLRLAVLQGTSSHYCLLKVLKGANLSEKDFDMRYMPAPEAKAAFETGSIDAWAVWAPFVEQQEVNGKGMIVEGGDAVINSVMTMSTPFLEQHKASAGHLVAVIHRAKNWIVEHPDEAQAIAVTELGLTPEVVKKAWPKHNWGPTLSEATLPDLQEKANFLADADKARARIDVQLEYVDLRYSK